MFLALRAQGREICYAGEKDLWECDFVTDTAVIQVCTELTPANLRREVGGILAASKLPGKREPLILTLDQRDHLNEEGREIAVLPAWEWMDH